MLHQEKTHHSKNCNPVEKGHVQYFSVAGLTIKIEAEIGLPPPAYSEKLQKFFSPAVKRPDITVTHSCAIPDLTNEQLGERNNSHPFFRSYKSEEQCIYIYSKREGALTFPYDFDKVHTISIFDRSHTHGRVYHCDPEVFNNGEIDSIFFTGSDQLLLSTVLPRYSSFLLHGSGLVAAGEGLLFSGRSGSGKSTIAKLLWNESHLLCDDRIIVKQIGKKFTINGTWHHGEIPNISSGDAPLEAVYFLVQDSSHYVSLIEKKNEKMTRLLENTVTPVTTKIWWERVFAIWEHFIEYVPFYYLHFAKDKGVAELLKQRRNK